MENMTYKKLEGFCKKWGLSKTHLDDLIKIFEEYKEDAKVWGDSVDVPQDCDIILAAFLSRANNEIIGTASVDVRTKEVYNGEMKV